MTYTVLGMKSDFRKGISDGREWTIDNKFLTLGFQSNSPQARLQRQNGSSFGIEVTEIKVKNDFKNLVFVNDNLPVNSFNDLEGCKVKVYMGKTQDGKDFVECIEVISID